MPVVALQARQPPGRVGSAGAPEAESSGERFRSWGAARLQRSSSWKRIPVPLPKEDYSVLAYCHIPLCCWGLTNPVGSRANAAADRPYPSIITSAQQQPWVDGKWLGGWRRRTLERGWSTAATYVTATALAGASISLHRQRVAGTASPSWQAGREWEVPGRKGEP